jgi:Golgi phosphoprotein 3 (GPP34)
MWHGGIMSNLSLAEELVLLAYDDEGRSQLSGTNLDLGLGGALLLELALAGRVDVVDKRVVVADPAPVGHPLVDGALDRIRAEGKSRKPKDWVSKLSKHSRPAVLRQLVAAGTLESEEDKVLLVFSRTRYPSAHGVEPPAETEARQRMRAAVTGTADPDARTAALCALVAAVGLDRKVFPHLPRKQVKERLKRIGEGAWAATAVKKAIEEVQAAITVAVVASTSAATAGGSS